MTKVSALDQALSGLEHARHCIEEQERRWRQRVEQNLSDAHPTNQPNSDDLKSGLGNSLASNAKPAGSDPTCS